MKMTTLTLTLACCLPTSAVFAAAMDRSGQSISSFLQPNNYAEAGFSILDADVSGHERYRTFNGPISDMADSYSFGTAAFKFQLNDQFSVGLIYDQPFGARATYDGNNFLVSTPNDKVLLEPELTGIKNQFTAKAFNALTAEQRVGAAVQAQGFDLATPQGQQKFAVTLAAYNADTNTKNQIDTAVEAGVRARVNAKLDNVPLGTGGTSVNVTTNNYSLIFGFKPIENITVYGGPVYQTVKGKLGLRGAVASVFNGYDAEFDETGDLGWLVGAAYEIPEIALKASLTYRSEIEHDIKGTETFTNRDLLINDLGINLTNESNTKVETPQSVNFDFQTGIMANTVAFANIRWVNWDGFGIRPSEFGKVSKVLSQMQRGHSNGFDVIKYSDDQWSINTGIGRKINDKWAGTVSVGYDTGAGNPVSSLGPTEGYTNVGVGIQYSPAPHYFVGGGVKYFWLGDADAQISSMAGTSESVGKFEDNTAIAYGLKMGYRF